ncbi:DUF3168 domain-containing protein [Mesorhizobium sp. WSM2239]|uniref:DUF3168 domain-containing protein n=2 Tax=unclassified Mesorhizobium TaxID=325217 RepID=A0AAU8D261_9HYPH
MIGSQLQKAIFAALITETAVADGRIYDRVPENPTFPYVTIGDAQVINDGNSCGDGWEVFEDVHLWSRPESGSKVEVKDLAPSVVSRLATTLAVTGFVVILAELNSSRTFRDPDGLTEHSVLTFRFLLDPA